MSDELTPPTPEDMARDAAADMGLCRRVEREYDRRGDGSGLCSLVEALQAWIRRAVAAERRAAAAERRVRSLAEDATRSSDGLGKALAENTSLKAEVERLGACIDAYEGEPGAHAYSTPESSGAVRRQWEVNWFGAAQDSADAEALRAENAELKAELERHRRSGEDAAKLLGHMMARLLGAGEEASVRTDDGRGNEVEVVVRRLGRRGAMNDLKAGRELDALVAEKVMGLANVRRLPVWNTGEDGVHPWPFGEGPDTPEETDYCHDRREWRGPPAIVPAYSADIAAAWQVVERMRALGWECEVDVFREGPCHALFTGGEGADPDGLARFHGADGDSVPLAVCLAALEALGVTP